MFKISVKDVKDILRLDTTQFDDYIEKMLPITLALIEQHCNNKQLVVRDIYGAYLRTAEGYLLADMGLILIVAKIIEFYMSKAGVTYEAIGRMTFTYANDLPKPILESLQSYSKARLKFF